MKITAAHGGGGKQTAALIRDIFAPSFGGNTEDDAVALDISGNISFTADSFVVRPLFFKGGDIGRLAVCGTVNDLLTSGALPLYLSASFIIEEGAETDDLARIARSMRAAADEAGVRIVTGDTKVIEGAGGVYVSTSGVGRLDAAALSFKNVQAGDAIIVTGNLGDHHACILSARLNIDNDIESDAAPLTDICAALKRAAVPVRAMRDVTRGGLATCLNEAAASCGLSARINEAALPVSDGVGGLCAMLGLDPLYMANEGKMLIVTPPSHAAQALTAIRAARYGSNAQIIGAFEAGAGVVLQTKIGGRRVVPILSGEALPRIC